MEGAEPEYACRYPIGNAANLVIGHPDALENEEAEIQMVQGFGPDLRRRPTFTFGN